MKLKKSELRKIIREEMGSKLTMLKRQFPGARIAELEFAGGALGYRVSDKSGNVNISFEVDEGEGAWTLREVVVKISNITLDMTPDNAGDYSGTLPEVLGYYFDFFRS